MDRITLLRSGTYVSTMTSEALLLQVISSIRPIVFSKGLIRVGPDGDGGYLVPNDLQGLHCCFSPGVSSNSGFEKDLDDRYSIKSHLADSSVNGPTNYHPKSFLKKNISSYNSVNTITLSDWVRHSEPQLVIGTRNQDLLLQMDIEGSEYAVLLSTPRNILAQFRILVIEFHDVWAWGSDSFFRIVYDVFAMLNQDFQSVHIHPNNATGIVHLGNVVVPQGFEITFIRKDRIGKIENQLYSSIPHSLDQPNDAQLSETKLPNYWGGQD
jgi:hypothetical protein